MNRRPRSAPAALALIATCSPVSASSHSERYQSYLAHLAAADACLRLNEAAGAARWLVGAPEPERGWEWSYLNAQVDQSLRAVAREPEEVLEIAYSPDGGRIALACADGTLVVRAVGKGSERLRIKAHDRAIWRVQFSPDGALIVTAAEDRLAKVFDAASGEERAVFRGYQTPVTGADFSPDGSLIASSNYTPLKEPPYVDGTLKVWDPRTGEEAFEIRGVGVKPLSMVRWSPDGTRLGAVSWDGEVYLCDVATRTIALKIDLPDDGIYNAANCVAFNPDGALIASGTKDGTANIHSTSTGELVARLRHDGWVTWTEFSADGATLATASHDSLIRLWDTATWTERAVLRGHTGGPWCLAFSPDGKRLISSGNDGKILEWDPAWSDHAGVRRFDSEGCYAVQFSPDGGRMYSCNHDGTIHIRETRAWSETASWTAHEGSTANTIGLSADGRRLVSCSWDKTAKVWDAHSGDLVATFNHEGGVYHAAINPDGTIIATAPRTTGAGVAIWSVDRPDAPVRSLDASGKGISDLVFSPDGSAVAAACSDGMLRLWDAATGERRHELRAFDESASSVAFTADGRSVLLGSRDGKIAMWNAADGALHWIAAASDSSIHRIAASQDGRRIAIGSTTLRLLSPRSGDEILTLRPHPDNVWHLCFSRDGSRLAACTTSGTIAILDTATAAERYAAAMSTPHPEARTRSEK